MPDLSKELLEVRIRYFAVEPSGRRFSVTREALEHYAERWEAEGMKFVTQLRPRNVPHLRYRRTAPMILSGESISHAVAADEIRIDPFDPSHLNPASYDLTLGDNACVYTRAKKVDATYNQTIHSVHDLPEAPRFLDAKAPNNPFWFKLRPEGFRVEGRRVLLLHTRERIRTHAYVPVIDGKSSLGRLGLAIHVTAGYGDPGFDGQYTLEVIALGEGVILYPGMRIAQVRFHHLEGDGDYAAHGHYTGAAAVGPVPSRSYLQFRDADTIPAPAPGSGEHPALKP